MSPLVRVAFEALQEPETNTAVRSVACSTILLAIEQGLEVPAGAQMVIWRNVVASESATVLIHRHELIDEAVARDAVRLLLEPDSGESACDLAVAVLKGENVRAISDDELIMIADRMMDEGHVRRFSWLVERMHEERGLAPEVLVALRDQLAGSENPTVRVGAVEVGGLAARLDQAFVVRMIDDSTPPVRTAVADLLEKVAPEDKPLALALARAQLNVERHRTVLSALHYAIGSLVSGGRARVPSWEPSGGRQN